MDFDRAEADPETARDHLVLLAHGDKPHDLALPRREPCGARRELPTRGGLPADGGVLIEGSLDAVEKRILLERLLQELEGAGPQGCDRDRHRAVTRDEDDRDAPGPGIQ